MNFLESTVSSPSTKRVLESLYRNWLAGREEQRPEELVNFWLENGLKPATIKKLLCIYKKWHQYNYKENVNLASLVRRVNRMKGAAPPKAWTKEEAEKALQFSKNFDFELYKIILFVLHTGARRGEIFGLKWKDIDFINKKINIQRSWDGPTKTGRPRSIPMSKQVEELLLKNYTGNKEENCFKFFEPNTRLKNLCKMIGIREITMHGGRHTFCSLGLSAGKSPKLVAAMAGHQSVSTTLNIYWQLTGENLELDFLP